MKKYFIERPQSVVPTNNCNQLKFIYSEKATKFCEISNLLLSVCTVFKSKVEISQNFVAFSEYTNFNNIDDFNEFLLLLKSLIEEHARLDFLVFLSTRLAISYVINEKFQNDRLFRSPRLLGTSE